MAAYLRELLRDVSLFDQEDIEAGSDRHITRIDVYHAIKYLYQTKQLEDRHILALNAYFLGDQRTKLRLVPGHKELLSYSLARIAEIAGYEYSDDYFVSYALTRYPKYTRMRKAFLHDMTNYGETFYELAE